MAREGSVILDSGDRFPALRVSLVSGGTLDLPDGLPEGWNVVLFYRAHW